MSGLYLSIRFCASDSRQSIICRYAINVDLVFLCVWCFCAWVFPSAMPAGPCRGISGYAVHASAYSMHPRSLRGWCSCDWCGYFSTHSLFVISKFQNFFHLLFYVDCAWMMRHHLLGIVLDKCSIIRYHFNFFLPFYSTAAVLTCCRTVIASLSFVSWQFVFVFKVARPEGPAVFLYIHTTHHTNVHVSHWSSGPLDPACVDCIHIV